MFVSMLVGLYTSRVVLQTLGVSDYGVYNVMGGIIGMLMYVNNLLSGGTSRFLMVDLGHNDLIGLKETFSIANTLSYIAVCIVLVLGETIGLWFMNTHLNIELARMSAANWVYQCAVFSCCITILQTPYTASIISHERMDIYAYLSIFDVSMKLFIVYVLMWFDADKLKLYAILVLVVNLLGLILYYIICRHYFLECSVSLSLKREKIKSMISYSGWNMVGGIANVLNNYGLNILLNVFFGTVVNAARGIALQVSQIVQQFYSSVLTASRPQIIKLYAEGDIDGMSLLIRNTSKYCTCLLLCLIIPVFFNIDGFLLMWLEQVPEYTSWFTRVLLLQILFQSIDYPIGMGIHAVGKMRLPNLTSALIYFSVFPLTYICFKFGVGVLAGYCVYLAFAPFILLLDLFILKKYTGFSIFVFFRTVLIPLLIILMIVSAVSGLFYMWLGNKTIMNFILSCAFSFFATIFIVYFFGLTKQIRQTINNYIRLRIQTVL